MPEHIERAEQIKLGQIEPGAPIGGEEEETASIVDADSEGFEIYKRSTCINCHGNELEGMGTYPPLLGIGDKYTRDELVDIMKNGINTMPAGFWDASIADGLSEEEMNLLADRLASQVSSGEEGDDAASGEEGADEGESS